MFGKRKINKPQNRIDCLIGAGTTIEGNILFSGGLRVDGHVRGNVIAANEKPGTGIAREAWLVASRASRAVGRFAANRQRH